MRIPGEWIVEDKPPCPIRLTANHLDGLVGDLCMAPVGGYGRGGPVIIDDSEIVTSLDNVEDVHADRRLLLSQSAENLSDVVEPSMDASVMRNERRSFLIQGQQRLHVTATDILAK